MVTKKLLFFFFAVVNCSIAFGAQKFGPAMTVEMLNPAQMTNVPPSIEMDGGKLFVRTTIEKDDHDQPIKYDVEGKLIPFKSQKAHTGKYSTIVNSNRDGEFYDAVILATINEKNEIVYSIEIPSTDQDTPTKKFPALLANVKTEKFFEEVKDLADCNQRKFAYMAFHNLSNQTNLDLRFNVSQIQQARAQAHELENKKNKFILKPTKSIAINQEHPQPALALNNLKDALAQIEPDNRQKDESVSLKDFKLPHRIPDISPSDYFNSLLPDQRKACLSAAYNHDLQKVATNPVAFSKMADMSPQKYYSELSEEKRQEFHQSVYDLHKKRNTDAKKVLFHKLSTDLKQQLEQWNDPKDEEKKTKLVDFVTHVFYVCHDNDDLRLDFKDISNKLFTAIRYEEQAKDVVGHEQAKEASKSGPLTDKFKEIARTAEHRLQQDLPLYNKCVQATNKINIRAAELEEENNRPFGQYVKDSVGGAAMEVALPVVVQEFGECIGLVIASFIDNPETKKEIVRLEKEVQDLKEILADPDNDTEKYKKDLQKALYQKVQANQKLINGDNSKKTKTKEELLQAFKDLNEGK